MTLPAPAVVPPTRLPETAGSPAWPGPNGAARWPPLRRTTACWGAATGVLPSAPTPAGLPCVGGGAADLVARAGVGEDAVEPVGLLRQAGGVGADEVAGDGVEAAAQVDAVAGEAVDRQAVDDRVGGGAGARDVDREAVGAGAR